MLKADYFCWSIRLQDSLTTDGEMFAPRKRKTACGLCYNCSQPEQCGQCTGCKQVMFC